MKFLKDKNYKFTSKFTNQLIYKNKYKKWTKQRNFQRNNKFIESITDVSDDYNLYENTITYNSFEYCFGEYCCPYCNDDNCQSEAIYLLAKLQEILENSKYKEKYKR